jgi:midasin
VNNVNLCSASVFDRLNSLLKTDGTLLITESGDGRVVTPHPNFHIFFTMDVTYGEISRAMRNRYVEILVNGHEIVYQGNVETPFPCRPYHDSDIHHS